MRNLRLVWGLGLGAAVLAGVIAVPAQQQTAAANDDPANLKGERVAAAVVPGLPPGGIPGQGNAGALWQNLLKLKTRASLLMIVAHPDDEDGGMLTYEVRGQGVRAGMMTLTRGEGGQNLMSADFNDALGLVRTQELLAADRYLGIQQFFGTEADFGFCKSREEALAKWGHDRVLYDAVRAVRLFRPLVVTSVFVGGPTDGHGHHQVAGEMAQEVYTAAGDPKMFPEMGLPAWSPLKSYGRAPAAGVQGRQIYDSATGKTVPLRFFNYITQTRSDEVPGVNVVVHEGEVSDKLGGMSYVEFARQGLGLQKTQIGNGVRRGGRGGAFDVRYHRWASRVPTQETEQSFFDGIDVSLAGIASLAPGEKTFLPQGLAKLQGFVDAAMSGYSGMDSAKIAPALKDALVTVRGLIVQVEKSNLGADEKYNVLHELRAKEVQANDALAQAIGLTVNAKLTSAGPVVPGITVKVQAKTTAALQPLGVKVEVGDASATRLCIDTCAASYNPLTPTQSTNELDVKMSVNEPITRPYFSRPNFEQPYYDVHDATLRNAPETPAPLTAWVTAMYEGVEVHAGEVVQEPDANSAVPKPVMVVPAVSLAVTPSEGILLPATKSVPLEVKVSGVPGTVKLNAAIGWQAAPASASFSKDATLHFDATPMGKSGAMQTITAVAEAGGKQYSEGYRIGGYDGLTPVYVYAPATYKTRAVDVKVAPGLRVAYLEGTGDEVPQDLKNMGVNVTPVEVWNLNSSNLADYDVVVLGVRVFTAHGDIEQAGPPLMEFVKNGGTVIVQYDTSAVPETLAPYPFVPGGNPGGVVVEEDSKVVLTPVASAVMRWPNQITEKDFDGWVEERGHGFARTFDPQYLAPTETHDAGQDPQRGGLLIANYGKGYYIYCAFALYRQMPEGVAGAYRLFANMLSVGKAPAQ